MGIELDVLVGHPEHDLLFVATQVALAANMKNPKQSVNDLRNLKREKPGAQLSTLVKDNLTSAPKDELGRSLRKTAIMFSESEVYAMLLRSSSPRTEAFRKWVTEEVLSTIRKTGKYDAEQSTNPIALGVMDELKALRGDLASLRELVQAKPLTVARPTLTAQEDQIWRRPRCAFLRR